MTTSTAFTSFTLNGVDAQKIPSRSSDFKYRSLSENLTIAICRKGRFSLVWLKKINPESFEIVTTQDQAEEFSKHIKKIWCIFKNGSWSSFP